jgi:hypothetical protein
MAHCPNCGGELKIIAAILELPVIEKILTHLGLEVMSALRAMRWRMPVCGSDRQLRGADIRTVNVSSGSGPVVDERQLYGSPTRPAGFGQ